MTQTNECCPEFDPVPYHNQEHIWKDKLFIKDSMPTFLHMPLPGQFGKVVTRMWKKIEAAGASPEAKDFLMLSADPTAWRSELYINTLKEVSGAENVRLSGTFMSRVFDGPFQDIRKWVKEMEDWMKQEGKPVKNLYFYYTTCPKCAKKYGHNYVVGFAQVD
ncbi:MAG: hydrolase [Bacteroidales bacterium]